MVGGWRRGSRPIQRKRTEGLLGPRVVLGGKATSEGPLQLVERQTWTRRCSSMRDLLFWAMRGFSGGEGEGRGFRIFLLLSYLRRSSQRARVLMGYLGRQRGSCSEEPTMCSGRRKVGGAFARPGAGWCSVARRLRCCKWQHEAFYLSAEPGGETGV